MPKIDLTATQPKTGSIYPVQFATQMEGRSNLRLADGAGLTQFGANITILAPGAKSSLRHWHENQDEFVMVISGELTLVDDTGNTALNSGECAAFPAGDANGHHIINSSKSEGRFLVIGARTPTEVAHYSDVDMRVDISPGTAKFSRRDGSPLAEPDK